MWRVLGVGGPGHNMMPVSIARQVYGQQESNIAWQVREWPVRELGVEAKKDLIVSRSVPSIVVLRAPRATGPGCDANEHRPASS